MADPLHPAPPWQWAHRAALWRHWLRDPVESLGDLIPHHVMRLLPTDRVSAIGAILGARSGSRRLEATSRAAALLRHLRPEAGEAEVARLVAAHWAHVGRCFAEFSALSRFRVEGRISFCGVEHVLGPRQAGRPLIVAGLHVGNWEVVHAGLAALDIPFHAIYQRLPNRFRMRIADAARHRSRATAGPQAAAGLAPTLGAAFEAHRLLETRSAALLYYVDEYWQGRVHAPALGRPLAMKGNIMRAVRLAAATGAAIVPAYALRIGEQARYRLTFLPEVPIGPHGRGRAAILDDIAALDAAIDPVVRAHPEQWFMLHAFRPDR